MTPSIYPDFHFAQFIDFCDGKINENKNCEIFCDYTYLKNIFHPASNRFLLICPQCLVSLLYLHG